MPPIGQLMRSGHPSKQVSPEPYATKSAFASLDALQSALMS